MIITHVYGRYFSKGILLITSLMFLLGFLIHPIVAVILFLIGVISFIPKEILEINTETKQYRNVFVFLNYKKGEWINLGTVQYLSIITNNFTLKSSGPSKSIFAAFNPNIDTKGSNCKLRFFKKAGYYIEIDEFKSIDDAIKLGKEIAIALNLKLLNATLMPASFINL